jgi:hypothetical protein
MQKKQKIKPEYLYPKNHRTDFSIATPAARVSHSTPGSLPAASAQILTAIFWYINIRAGKRTDIKRIFSFSSLNFYRIVCLHCGYELDARARGEKDIGFEYKKQLNSKSEIPIIKGMAVLCRQCSHFGYLVKD